jgi:hypothetical protein
MGFAQGKLIYAKNGHMPHQRVFLTCFWRFFPSNGQNNAFSAHLSHKRGLKKANGFVLDFLFSPLTYFARLCHYFLYIKAVPEFRGPDAGTQP